MRKDKRNNDKKKLVFFLVFITLLVFLGSSIRILNAGTQHRSHNISSSISLIDTPPLLINGNQELIDFVNASGDVFLLGNITHPLLIQNLNISGTSGNRITIRNTNLHFRITGCYLDGGADGIHFSNVTYGQIVNTTVINSGSEGIWLESSPYAMIKNNTVENSYQDGITLHSSRRSKITYNRVIHAGTSLSTGYGMYVYGSPYAYVANNYVFESYYAAIELADGSPHSSLLNNTVIRNMVAHSLASTNSPNATVLHNKIYGAGTQGITIRYSNHSVVEWNEVQDDYYGILLLFSWNTNVSYNTLIGNEIGIHARNIVNNSIISHNILLNNHDGIHSWNADSAMYYDNLIKNSTAFGLILEVSSNNQIFRNEFINNNPTGNSQVTDFDNTFEENNVSYNYWSDYTSPDSNNDGIVDQPYSFLGNSVNEDSRPLVYSTGTLAPISILYPSSGQEVTGVVTIEWTPSANPLKRVLSYNVHTKIVSAVEWTEISSSLLDTSYTWDISSYPEGNYLLKVKVCSTDGLETEIISDSPFTITSELPDTTTTTTTTLTLSTTTEPSSAPSSGIFFLIGVTFITRRQKKRFRKK